MELEAARGDNSGFIMEIVGVLSSIVVVPLTRLIQNY